MASFYSIVLLVAFILLSLLLTYIGIILLYYKQKEVFPQKGSTCPDWWKESDTKNATGNICYPPNEIDYTAYNSSDAGGNDIMSYQISLEECESNCNSTTGCVGFTYQPSTRGCWVKNKFIIDKTDRPDLTSYKRNQLNKIDYTAYNSSDAGGNDIMSYQISLEECESNCNSTTGCVGFTYQPSTRGCWVKNKFIINSSDRPDLVSYKRNQLNINNPQNLTSISSLNKNTNICDLNKLANKNKIVWDGVTNYNGC